MELDDFTLYLPRTSLPSDTIQSLPTFWLNMTTSRHTSAVETKSEDNYPPKISCEVIFPLLYIYHNLLRKDFFGFN